MQHDSPGISFAPTDLAKIIDLAPSFMVILRGPTLVVEVANKAYYQLVGNRQLVGLPIRQAFPEVEGQGFFELLETVFTTGTPWVGSAVPIELQRVPGGANELRYLDLVYQVLRGPDNGVVGIFAHGIDVTDWKIAEEALQKASALAAHQASVFNVMLSAVTDFVYTFDRDGRFLYSNKALLELLQVPLEGLVGKNFFDLGYPAGLAARLQDQIAQVLATNQIVADETLCVRLDGSCGHYEYIFSPVLGADGAVVQVAGSTRDITSRKDAERALLESEGRKKDFLAMLAHELRTPLAPIRNGVDFLRRAGDGHAKTPALLQMMDRQISQMGRLIDDLLDANRISHGRIELRREPLELADVVRQAVEAAQPLFEHLNHELTVAYPAQPIRLDADPARLAQVVGNLLSNACKFTERGGRIGVAIERAAHQAIVRVTDSGIGIAAADHARIFEMFTQLDVSLARSNGGLGIGLTLVKDLVEMHGGTVEVQSDGPGRGSEFWLTLPRLPDGAASLPVPAPACALFGKRHILVVDDNPDVIDTLAALLQLSGHRVDIAHDGEQAVQAALRLRPDVVLLDIGLPRLDGYDAARQIRDALGGTVMLVAMTGWGQDDDLRRSSQAGFDEHLTKPVDYDVLTRVLAQWSGSGLPTPGVGCERNGIHQAGVVAR